MTLLTSYGLIVQELPEDTSTAESAARALNVMPKQIVKSLLVIGDREPTVVLAAGDRSVNLRLLASELGDISIRMASAREVKDLSGFTIGGVPPLGHKTSLRSVLDERLLGVPVVYAAAGTKQSVFGVSPQTLHEITGATVVRLS